MNICKVVSFDVVSLVTSTQRIYGSVIWDLYYFPFKKKIPFSPFLSCSFPSLEQFQISIITKMYYLVPMLMYLKFPQENLAMTLSKPNMGLGYLHRFFFSFSIQSFSDFFLIFNHTTLQVKIKLRSNLERKDNLPFRALGDFMNKTKQKKIQTFYLVSAPGG